ncbi:thioredoxin-like domain-containing protein [Gallaecimonas sp. GXIMD4217]|uniref:thioredoxin-like domain-containing protein n=1 Tax=Gallaecimonas sp. GXIMD4217 TaxID=3131927 RepID=UPI00311B0209
MKSWMKWALLALGVVMFAANGAYRERAVPFGPELQWLNVTQPLTLEGLRGKVVILDFWTYGCVNCMHVLPDLKKLEQKYGHRLAVISIHSPKFDNEKRLKTLQRIVARYDIDHAVANDVAFSQWRQYGVRAWPSFVVIDPAGRVVGKTSGEGRYQLLDQVVAALLEEFKGRLDETPLPLKPLELAEQGLAAPGKVAVSDKRVAVADTGHHRIVLADHQGQVQAIIGSGEACAEDGGFEVSCFRDPQGLAFLGQSLYVADTGNHLVRRIDLRNKQVTTVAGTGQLGGYPYQGGPAQGTAIRSPWDLVALDEHSLAIAMAGSHQIWRLDLKRKRLEVLAGTGREALEDGSFEASAFNQPSGLALHGERLWVADSEASAIRELDLNGKRVKTLVGQGLFDFGHKDGPFAKALLQHALGVLWWDKSTLYVADTYNHGLRRLDLEKGQISTVPLPDNALNEPGGLARLGERLLVADTNQDRLLLIEPLNGKIAPFELAF